ncbi:hypothetical protein [Streptomyces sp. NPDC051546]|uniref:hypothetical protein n=1 Tax=Streptomyces sp. NPDC051546 TaxID=3365655 RepID=UPI00378C7B0F
MKNHIADVSRRTARIREAATGAQLVRHSRKQIAGASGGAPAWDWDVYFDSGNRPGPETREGITPSRPSRAPHLRLVREMNWDAYFNTGRVPSAGPAPQARNRPSHIRQSAT